jgi:uncharacterized protein (DUF302 family)
MDEKGCHRIVDKGVGGDWAVHDKLAVSPCGASSPSRAITKVRFPNRRNAMKFAVAAFVASGAATGAAMSASLEGDGVVSVRSAYGFDETIRRLKADIADKKIMFFDAIDQAKLASGAGIELRPSTLLIFGNPPLGIQFLTSKPAAGLDWPVRLLVAEDAQGQVWAMYTDFAWIARRHGIENRNAAFKMASDVIASIASSVAQK